MITESALGQSVRGRKRRNSITPPFLQMGSSSGGVCETIPDAVCSEIFRFLPASQIAGVCTLVCKSWKDIASESLLWSQLCQGAGLSASDCLRCLGGWKALFGTVFGQNLVATPHFEQVLHMDAEMIKNRIPGPWEPKHRLLLDRLCSLDENHDDSHAYSYWAVEGGCVFQRGGGDGIVRELPPVGCPPCPAVPHMPVLATSFEWGKVQQYIGLQTFSSKFLDSSPPILVSVWYAGRCDTSSKVKLQVLLRDELKNGLMFWDSGEILAKEGEWQEAKGLVRGYPPGLRSIILKVGGTSVSSKKKHGFFGAKFTALSVKFVPPFEVKHLDTGIAQFGKTILFEQ